MPGIFDDLWKALIVLAVIVTAVAGGIGFVLGRI